MNCIFSFGSCSQDTSLCIYMYSEIQKNGKSEALLVPRVSDKGFSICNEIEEVVRVQMKNTCELSSGT